MFQCQLAPGELARSISLALRGAARYDLEHSLPGPGVLGDAPCARLAGVAVERLPLAPAMFSLTRREFLELSGLSTLSGPLRATARLPSNERRRARDLGVRIGRMTPGRWNAITDVPGLEVGHVTLIHGSGPLRVGEGPVRTGVTAIWPNRGDPPQSWRPDLRRHPRAGL